MKNQDRLFTQMSNGAFENIINSLPGGVVVFKKQGKKIETIFVNEGTYQLFGYSKEVFENLYHSDLFEVVYQPDLIKLKEKFDCVTSVDCSFEHECRCYSSLGKLVWIYFRVNCISKKADHNIFVALITDSSKERQLEEKSRINEEMYHIAFNQGNVFLLEYDHHSNKLFSSNYDSLEYFDSPAFSNIPESMIETRLIHERSIDDFYNFYHQIVNGVKDGEVKLKVRSIHEDKYVWVNIKFTNIYDNDNHPIKAVGVYQNINEQVNLESRYLREMKYRQKLMRRSITNLEVNLSTNEVIKTHNVTYKMLKLDENATYSDFIKAMSKLVADKDKELFTSTFAIENVIDSYHKGIDDIRISFLFYQSTKKRFGWISAHMMFVYNEESNQLIGFFYTNDIDDDKRKTIELTRQARTDALTGLINRRELQRVISEEIKSINEGSYGALFMIDVDDFKLINDTNGHSAGDETLRFIADRLKSLFRSDDVVGRFGGDEFMVYMKDVSDKKIVTAKARQISEALTTTYSDYNINISCSVGVTFISDNTVSFDKAYYQADQAAYDAKKNGKRSYHVF